MDSYKIAICFSDTGGGHRSAAEAVEEGLKEVAGQLPALPRLDISLTNIAERSHPINKAFVGLYNYLLRHRQEWMKYYYWFLEVSKPNDSPLGYLLARKYVIAEIKRLNPSVVVSVHPMVNHYLSKAMKELGLSGRVKLITVITDPNANLWKGWACEDADLIIAPNDLAADKLISWGIRPERVKIIGMPIQPQFVKPPRVSRHEFLSVLKLDPGRLTVCITAGWAGGGNMTEVYEALETIDRPVQVIFICGHNKDLLEEIQAVSAKSNLPTAVLPFLDSMSDMMASVDLLVTKAGGLTTFEAIARRLPMAIDLLTEAMPQESGTADMLIEQGLASALRKPEDIRAIVEALETSESPLSRPLPQAHSLDRVDAIFDIAKAIIAACDPSRALVSVAPAADYSPARNAEAKPAQAWGPLSGEALVAPAAEAVSEIE